MFKSSVTSKIYSLLCLITLACGSHENTENKELISHPVDSDYNDYLYQYSIIDALLAGVYDGTMTFGEIKSKGNLGLGTFNRIDGELFMNDGEVFKIRYDGSVHPVNDSEQTPLAFVKHFQPDTIFEWSGNAINYEQFEEWIGNNLHSNELYAIRISGPFSRMHTRAPAPAQKPYPPLVDYLADNQHEFTFEETLGVAVGFYLPEYIDRMNVPGFHFHYLSEDQQSGGHILDFETNRLKVEVDKASGVILENMDNRDFLNADLVKDRGNEMNTVERGR